LPLGEGRMAAMDQIHESVEGHEDEIAAHGESKLTHSVSDELERTMREPA